MNLVDYTGKLNTHEEYVNMIKKLEKKTKYIEIVVIDEIVTNNIVNKFKNDIISIKIVSEWWQTKTLGDNKLVKIKASTELFEYLLKFETFCKYHFCKKFDKDFGTYVDVQENTDFGYDDIAFYDDNNDILLCTTTHECYISINEKLM